MNTVTIRNKQINFIQRPNFFLQVARNNWEPRSFDVLDRFIRPGTTFIDIGAWNGVLSLYAAALGADCYAVEPDLPAFVELVENINANNFKIHPSLLAISDTTGRAKLNSRTFDGFGNSEGSLIVRDMKNAETEVITMTLSDFIIFHAIVDKKGLIIKIDSEGSEILILKNQFDFIRLFLPTLFISFHPAWLPDLKNDVETFVRILFPIYDLYSVNDLDKKISEKEYRAMLTTEHEHSFVLIGKK